MFWTKMRLGLGDQFAAKCQMLVANGTCIPVPEGRLEMNVQPGMNSPWVFLTTATQRSCTLWNGLYFKEFGHIPKYCRERCWKNVIKPRTVYELFQLYTTLKSLDLPSKCGVDKRDYTCGAYAGFNYNDTIEEGREAYKILREAVSDNIHPDVPVFLKKGCTEFELVKPSNEWLPMTEQEREMERQLDDTFKWTSHDYKQPNWQINHIKRSWLKEAYRIADMTYKDVIQQDLDFGPITITYHEEESVANSKGELEDGAQ
jgi:hypothetical protein